MSAFEEFIKAEILRSGPITFERFMDLALYHPEYGYYASGRAAIGKKGDFYTSPHATPVFGRLMAEVFVSLPEALGNANFSFVEMGAGEGYFASDFLGHIRRYYPAICDRLEYIIVERSAGMAKAQRETLGEVLGKVTWHSALSELPGPVRGVIFSNELVDAFPFHRVAQEGDKLKEIYITVEDGRLVETAGEPSTPLLAEYFRRLGITLPDGMATEINLRALDWMREVGAALAEGYAITIDYGYPASEYYSPARNRGTFLCYYRHQANEDPLINIGEQDITAHVDFTSLADAGKEAGLAPLLFTDQTSFFLAAAVRLEQAMTKKDAAQAEMEELARGMKAVLHPDILGATFKVLVQGKCATGGEAFKGIRNRLEIL